MTTHKLIRLTAAVLLAATVSSGTFATTAEWSPTVQAAAQNIKLNEKQAVAKFKQKYAKAKISEISLVAEKAAKSGQGREWTLETDHGQTIWQVDVVDGHQKTEVKINAVNKKVISVETDD